MAFDYSEFVGVADELIAEFGREVILRKTAREAANSNRPWEGPVAWDDATEPTDNLVKAQAVFIGRGMALTQGKVAGQQQEMVDGVLTQQGTDIFIVSGSVQADLRFFSRITDGTEVWIINKVVRLCPGDTVVAYIIEVNQ